MQLFIDLGFGIEKNILQEEGMIPSSRFNNIIFAAETIGDFDLIALAIKHLAPLIVDDRKREVCLLLAYAFLHFNDKEYHEVDEFLHKLVNANNLPKFFILRKHQLSLKCIFDQHKNKKQAYEELKAKEATFRSMLDREKKKGTLNNDDVRCNLNLYKLTKKMAKIANRPNARAIIQKKLISFDGKIAELKWLNEKIAELPE